MTTKLIIVRHGNTFDKGQVPVRVGLRTDMSLSASGREQAVVLGKYMKLSGIDPEAVFSSELRRTYETADIALKEVGIDRRVERLAIFNEVDYGVDEGKTEEELVGRIGEKALDLWNTVGIVPEGWIFDVDVTIENWRKFASMVEDRYIDRTVMVFTSNGIARFAPYITGDFEKFSKKFDIKISTGALGIFEKTNGEQNWSVVSWNLKPSNHLV